MRINGQQTPIDVLFSVFEDEFFCGKREIAALVLADRNVQWGRKVRNPRYAVASGDRGQARKLTDLVSNALPGTIPSAALDEPAVFAPALLDLIEQSLPQVASRTEQAAQTVDAVVAALIYTHAQRMFSALETYGCAADIFDNVLDSIRDSHFAREHDRALSALAFYVVSALTGDMPYAANMVVQYVSVEFGVYLLEELEPSYAETTETMPIALGVQRLLADGVRGRRHTLDPAGTIFGMLPDTDGSFIADVNNSVSYEHLVVWQEASDGRWYARGLGSQYGTTIERAGMPTPLVVEPPLSSDAVGEKNCANAATTSSVPEKVELFPGDILVLGSTRFEVQRFQRGV